MASLVKFLLYGLPLVFENFEKIQRTVNEIIAENFEPSTLIYSYNLDFETDYPTIKIDFNEDLKLFEYRKSQINVLNFRNEQDDNFEETLKSFHELRTFHPKSLMIIIMKNDSRFAQIFEITSKFFLSKVLLVTDNEEGAIYTYQPYKNENIQKPDLDIIKIVGTPKTITRKNPKKWTNSTITILHNLVVPYVMSAYTKIQSNKGIEMEIFDIVTQFLGFSRNYFYKEDMFRFWGFEANNSYTGVLRDLQTGKGDMAIGVFHSKKGEHLDFDLTFTYMEDAAHWIAPKALIFPHWKRLALIFSTQVYISIVSSFVIVSTILYSISYLKNEFKTWVLILYQILFEIGCDHFNTPKTRNVLTISWVLSSMVISTIFKSQLMNIMVANSYYEEIDTLEDIVEARLKFQCDIGIAEFYSHGPTKEEKYVLDNWIFCKVPLACLRDIALRKELQVAVDFKRSHLYNLPLFYVDHKGNPLVHVVKTPIFPLHIHLFFRKGYPMLDAINEALMRLKDTGIIQHVYDKTSSRAKEALNRKTALEQTILSFGNLQYAFWILAIGLISAILSFFIEVCITKFA